MKHRFRLYIERFYITPALLIVPFLRRAASFIRRFCAVFLCVLLVISGILSGTGSLKVRAAAAMPADLDASLELAMILYGILDSALVAGGIKEGLSDASSGKDLVTAFDDFLYSMYAPDILKDMTVTLDDGTVMTMREFERYAVALDPPDEDIDNWDDVSDELLEEAFWNVIESKKFAALDAYAAMKQGGGSDSDPDGGDGAKGFSAIKAVAIGSGVLAIAGAFVKGLWNGEADGLDPDVYYFPAGRVWNGKYAMTADGRYLINGWIHRDIDQLHYYYSTDSTFQFPPVCYLSSQPDGLPLINICYISGGSVMQSFCYFNVDGYNDDGLRLVANHQSVKSWVYDSYSLDVPVFSSLQAAEAYAVSGDLSGLLNGPAYDFSSLADSVPEVLAPLAGVNFSPGALPKIASSLSSAAQTLPEPAADRETNTQAYKQAVSDAVTDAVAETDPVPAEPSPVPGTGEAGDPIKYKRSLSLIFPFCIPFDLIHFFQVMDAEPEAPCFYVPFVVEPLGIDMMAELDMSFLEPAMEIFRLGELGLWIISLILVTSKVIRW